MKLLRKKEYFICDCCKELRDNSVKGFSKEKMNYCNECLNQNKVLGVDYCESCGGWFAKEKIMIGPDNGAYCEECLNDTFNKLFDLLFDKIA